MTVKLPAVTRFALLLAAGAVAGLLADAASAQPAKRRYYEDGRVVYNYGPGGPNASYQQGPRTRVYISKRSWLDGGTEVLPGDRKFTDYAFPSPYGHPTFARVTHNRPTGPQHPNPASRKSVTTEFHLY